VSKRIVYFCLFLSLLLLFYYPPMFLWHYLQVEDPS
jgi:hypothetical protein